MARNAGPQGSSGALGCDLIAPLGWQDLSHGRPGRLPPGRGTWAPITALVRYDEMRNAVERCARIDEAADLRDKAAALQAYARQRDDRDLDVWTSEIKLRANVRIGELVRELDRSAGGANPSATLPIGGKSKSGAIAEAGLSRSEAYRAQELAGPREEQAQKAGDKSRGASGAID